VSLIGEYSTESYRNRQYPAAVAVLAHFVHFPIRDFHVPVAEELESIVLELKLRLTQRREVVFVHCRGGHGRTGTVVIPLVAALFDLEDAAATGFVMVATSTHRPSDMRWGAEMPETAKQEAATRAANARVRMKTRKGR
jgi:protein-tyrosine phosphatase